MSNSEPKCAWPPCGTWDPLVVYHSPDSCLVMGFDQANPPPSWVIATASLPPCLQVHPPRCRAGTRSKPHYPHPYPCLAPLRRQLWSCRPKAVANGLRTRPPDTKVKDPRPDPARHHQSVCGPKPRSTAATHYRQPETCSPCHIHIARKGFCTNTNHRLVEELLQDWSNHRRWTQLLCWEHALICLLK